MSNMIPIHIADAAVAACEAEIQKLREENARLREAGEELARLAENAQDTPEHYADLDAAVKAWEAAKEGKQP